MDDDEKSKPNWAAFWAVKGLELAIATLGPILAQVAWYYLAR